MNPEQSGVAYLWVLEAEGTCLESASDLEQKGLRASI
jgi:hypothetical protein